MKNSRTYLSLCFLVVCFASLSGQDAYFPERGKIWQSAEPAMVGLNPASLTEAVDFAKENEYTGEVDLRRSIYKGFEREPFHKILGPTKKRGGPAGMIIKDGLVVAEWGDIKRVDMTFSVTKSYLSTVAGVAVDEGLISDVTDPVDQYVWDGTFGGAHNSKINWTHLLTQSSDWSGELWGGKDWADRPPREGGIDDWRYRILHEPGSHYEYNDVRVNVLAYSLLQVWRKPLPQVLKEKIMDPIGASSTWRWFGYDNSWTDVDGMKMQSVSGGGHSGGGLFISTEDHARFGYLFLNRGVWDGKRLLSEDWIVEATTASAANPAYGYMWWSDRQGSLRTNPDEKLLYYGAGFGGNFVVVDELNDMVMVFRWLEPSKMKEMVQKVHAAIK